MSVCLVAMPWQALESPSLPLALLRATCARAGLPVPEAYHGGVRWAEHLMLATGGEIGPAEYVEVAENGLFHGLGDWVFAGALHDDPDFGRDRLTAYAAARGLDVDLPVRMREHVAEYVERVVAEILATERTVVGFSTTFMQNVPSLVVAREVKRASPETVVVFGGGNCDGPMGAALHRNYRFVDLVLRGEGEVGFPALLTALAEGGDLARVPGLCWWDGVEQRRNPQPAPLPAGGIPKPDFDDWFDLMQHSPVAEYIEPKLVLESARGCWWGEVHHCTFCGLNGTGMAFRSKSPDALLDELGSLIERHQVLDVIMVDNIIDNGYFRDVLPRVAELGWDLRIHYEVKSNLRESEVRALRDARVAHVQPGIESLVSPVLSIMDKGVTGTRNVRTLRDLESAGLSVTWNWLYGFPGESPAQYGPVVDQIGALVHLQPPAGSARILLERFSPYFEDPALGFDRRATAELYRHVYALEEGEVHDMVYLFDTERRGLSEEQAARLRERVDWWAEVYPDSSLTRTDDGERVVVVDQRAGREPGTFTVEDPALVAAYRELENGRSPAALARKLDALGLPVPAARLDAWLAELRERALVFVEGGQYIALATTGVPVKVAV